MVLHCTDMELHGSVWWYYMVIAWYYLVLPGAHEKNIQVGVKLPCFWWKYACQHFSIVREKNSLGGTTINAHCRVPKFFSKNSTTMEKCWHVYFHQKRGSFTLQPTRFFFHGLLVLLVVLTTTCMVLYIVLNVCTSDGKWYYMVVLLGTTLVLHGTPWYYLELMVLLGCKVPNGII